MLLALSFLVACEATIGENGDSGGGGSRDSEDDDSDIIDTDSDTDDSDDTDDTDDSDDSDSGPTDTGPAAVDADGDGIPSDEDCDDSDATVAPGAEELCDEVDHNCDGSPTDGAVNKEWFYPDTDGDGFGDPNAGIEACAASTTTVSDNTDCDDTNALVNPDATERCSGIDDDCDSLTSEELLVQFEAETGELTDYTDQAAIGTATAPWRLNTLNSVGTLRFCTGTYYATLELGDSVNVVGVGGRDNVVLDSGGLWPVVRTSHPTQSNELNGLTLQNGVGMSGAGGGGLLLGINNKITIDDVVFKNNHGERGGAIWIPGSTVSITNSRFEGNEATTAAGGLHLSNGATVTVHNTAFVDNSAPQSGGGFYIAGTDSTFTGTQLSFSGNSPSDGHHENGWTSTTDPVDVSCSYWQCVVDP